MATESIEKAINEICLDNLNIPLEVKEQVIYEPHSVNSVFAFTKPWTLCVEKNNNPELCQSS